MRGRAQDVHDVVPRGGSRPPWRSQQEARQDRRRSARSAARHTGPDSLRFLNVLSRRYRKRDLHGILDNSSTHKTPEVKAWLEAHPRVHFHFTPTGASWLLMVEAWFSILTRKSVRRSFFDAVRALVKHIQRYIEPWNDNPTPFVWTREPAEIIKKALRKGSLT